MKNPVKSFTKELAVIVNPNVKTPAYSFYNLDKHSKGDTSDHALDIIKTLQGPLRNSFLKLVIALARVNRIDKIDKNGLKAIFGFAEHEDKWIRQPEDFVPRSYNSQRIVRDLFSHLFAKYKFPIFFLNTFGGLRDHTALLSQEGCIKMAQGMSPRNPDVYVPVSFTPRQAHYFLQAPSWCQYSEAARWGMAKAAGCSDELASDATQWLDLICHVCPEKSKAAKFWDSVLDFFARQTMLDITQVRPMVDYIRHVRFVYTLQPNGEYGVASPNFQMKGRTVQSIMEGMSRWHRELAYTKKTGNISHWEPSNLKPYYGESASWEYKVYEIITLKELQQEGRELHHCVASYAHSCANKSISIFTCQRVPKAGGHTERLLTIEVARGENKIRQARGKYNAKPCPEGIQLLNAFAGLNSARVGRLL